MNTAGPAVATASRDAAKPTPSDALGTLRRRVLEPVGRQLGLSPTEITLADPSAGRRALTFGARGLTDGRTVFLAPDLGPHADAVLVHELVHVAQQHLAPGTAGPAGPARSAAAVTDAEAEARALVEGWRAGRPLRQPVVPLAPGSLAAENGAVGTVPRPPATQTVPVRVAAPDADERSSDDAGGGQEAELGRIVDARWRAERARILDRLDGLWVDGDDARGCLQILDTFPFTVARAMARSLPANRAADLVLALDDDHHRSYPAAAVAALAGLAPTQLRRVEARNVQGLDVRGFDDVQLRAVSTVLNELRDSVTLQLLQGSRGTFFRGQLGGPPPPGTDQPALNDVLGILRRDAAAAQRLGAEAELKTLLADLGRTLRAPGEAAALDAVARLARLAPSPPPPGPPAGQARPSGGSAAASRPEGEPPDPGDRLRFVVGRLEAQGAIVRMLGALSDTARSANGTRPNDLLVVLAAREPAHNLVLIESLLSYGILDWEIRDAEAQFAYLLVRSLPLDAQERWKRLDQGKWFQRLEDNIPRADTLSGRYRGVGDGAGAVDPATVDRLTNDAMAAVTDIDAAVRAGLTGPTAVQLLRRLLQLGRYGRPGTRGAEQRSHLLSIAVRRLDSLGDLDRILDELPDNYLLDEAWRAGLLEILVVREPRHLERQVRQLLSYGILDWAVSSREAWLAYQLVRSLPAADQTRLQEEDPDRFARIQSNLTAAMQASSGIAAIGVQPGAQTRERLRDRLRDRRLWVGERAVELRSLIIQLYALDDRRWVFEQSSQALAQEVPALHGVVADLRLFHPVHRTTYQPEALRAPSTFEDVFGAVGRFILATPRLLGLLAEVLSALHNPEMRMDIDPELFQRLNGGELGGAQLQPREAVREEDRRAGRRGLPDANRLGIWIRPAEGRIGLDLPRLELNSLLHTGPGLSVHTGKVSLTGVHIVADFSDRGYHRPVGAQLDTDTVDVTDIVLATAASLVAATHLGLRPLKVKAGQRGDENLTVPAPPNTIPIPIIGPLINVLSNVLALTGTIPGLSSLGGLLLGPVTAGSGFALEQYGSFVANQTVTPIAEGLLGLITDGTFRKPRTVDERAKDAAAMMRSFAVSLGAVTIDGLSLGGEQQVASLTVRDVFLGVGFSRTTYLRHQIASLDRRAVGLTGDARAVVDLEKASLQTRLDALKGMEAELDRLESQHRWNANGLSDAERARLVTLSDQLRQTAGAVLDVGGIAVRGLSGRVEGAGLDVGPIHAEAAGPTRVGEYLPDEQLIARFHGERRGPAVADRVRQSEGHAVIGPITVLTAAGGGPAFRVRAGTLPTPDELRTTVDRLPPGRHRTELEPWVGLLGELARLDALPAEMQVDVQALDAEIEVLPAGERKEELTRWVTWMRDRRAGRAALTDAPRRADGHLVGAPRTAEQEGRRQQLRDDAARFFGIEIGTLSIGRISGELVADALAMDLVASDLDVTGLRSGTSRVDRVTGTDVRVGAGLQSREGRLAPDIAGALDRAGLPGLTPTARFGAGRLTAEGVDTPTATLASGTVSGLSGRVVPEGDDYRIPDLTVESATLRGLNYTSPGRSIFALGTTTTGRIEADLTVRTGPAAGAEPTREPRLVRSAAGPSRAARPVGERRLTELVVNHLRIARIDADRVGVDATEPAPGYRLEATSGALLGVWVRNLHKNLLDDKAAITGTLGVEQFDALRFRVLSRALDSGPTTITGRLDSPPPAGSTAAQTEAAGAVGVELMQPARPLPNGDTRIDLRGLELSEGVVTTPDGSVQVRRASIAGRLTQQADGRLRFDHLGPITVDVAALDWRTAGGAQLTARGRTLLSGIEAEGWWESEPDQLQDGRVRKGHKRLHLDRATIASIVSDDFHYRDGVVNVRLGRFDRPSAPGFPPLTVRDVQVQGLEWDSVEGVTAGRVDVGRTALDLAGQLDTALHIRGSVAASSIALNFFREGRIVARVRGGEGDIGLGTTASAADHHASFAGIDSGVVDIRRDSIEIGAGDSPGLHLPIVTLDVLNWHGNGIGLSIAPGDGAVTLLDTRARVSIELHPPGHAGGRFKRLVLRELTVSETRATGLRVLLGDSASIKLDSEDEAVIGPIELKPADGEDGFVVEPSRTGPGLVQRGGIELSGFRLPWVAADVTDLLTGNADIEAGGLTVEFLGVPGEALGLNVLLRNPSITAIRAQLGPKFGQIFALRPDAGDGRPEFGLRARLVSYQRREPGEDTPEQESVEVEGVNLRGFFYVNPASGIRVFIESADVVGTISHDLITGSGRIPQVVITNAGFAVDLATLLASKAPASSGALTGPGIEQAWDKLINDLRPYRGVVDHLNGTIDFDVNAGGTVVRVRLRLVDGAIDFQRLTAAINGSLPGSGAVVSVDFVVNDGDLELWIRTPRVVPLPPPLPPVVPPDLRIMRWHLATGEMRPARDDGLLPLWKALHPDPADRSQAAAVIAWLLDGPPGALGISNIEANLSLVNPHSIWLPLDAAGANFLRLAPNAIANLGARGGLRRGAGGANRPGAIDPISLDRATVSELHLVFGGTTVETGRIEITDLTDTRLTFSGLEPQLLTGRITRATADNIRWRRNPSAAPGTQGALQPGQGTAPGPGRPGTPSPRTAPRSTPAPAAPAPGTRRRNGGGS